MAAFIKTLIFTVVVPASAVFYFPYWMLKRDGHLLSEAMAGVGLVGLIPIAFGVSCYLMCAWDFAFAGHGTPAPLDPPKKLVAGRLYQIVRNPMYVGILLTLCGESILFSSMTLLGYALIIALCFHSFVVFYEESALKKKFGSSYEDYCKRVPRWMPAMRKTFENK